MESAQLIKDESFVKFSNILRKKISKGFVIEESNDKLPFVVLSKKGRKVNHNINFLLFCTTFGLWTMPWMYLSFVSSKPKKILVAIDEEGETFEENCYME